MYLRAGASVVLSLLVAVGAFAQSAEEKLKAAEQAYAERENNAPGMAKVQLAIDLYQQLADETTAANEKAFYFVKKSEALNFLGNASHDKGDKIKIHSNGINTADAAIKAFGISDPAKIDDATLANLKKMSPNDLETVASAIYFKAVNLGQWGQAKGVTTSLGRWPEMRSLAQNVNKLGKKETNEYGPHRLLGRAYYVIPGLLGGDKDKSKGYLAEAVAKTLAVGKNISRNGHNNLYYAEVLESLRERTAAKALLKEFVETTAEEAGATQIPEYKDAQRQAAELLKRM